MKKIEFADFVASMAYIAGFDEHLKVELLNPDVEDYDQEYTRIDVDAFNVARYHDYHVISIDAVCDMVEIILRRPE